MFLIGFLSPALAQGNDSPIGDVSFDSLDRVYAGFTDGANVLLCIGLTDKTYALWNIDSGAIGNHEKTRCLDAGKFKDLRSSVIPPRSDDSLSSISADTKFLPGTRIYQNVLLPGDCAPRWSWDYAIRDASGKVEEFFIFGRVKEPFTISNKYCEGGEDSHDVTISYDAVIDLQSVNIDQNTALFYSTDNNFARPFVTIVHKLPDTVWSAGGEYFIIPASLVQSDLDKAGPDLKKRYEVILRAIAAHEGR